LAEKNKITQSSFSLLLHLYLILITKDVLNEVERSELNSRFKTYTFDGVK